MAAKVGVAVFGLGRAGQYHLPNLGSNPDVVVRWLVDVAEAEAKAKELCERFELKDAQFVSTENGSRVFDDPMVSAVVVAAPTRFHEQITKQALQAGKDVFCEKPISFTGDVVQSCYDEAEKQGKILFCGFNKRFDEQHVQLRQRVQEGELGKLRLVSYNWRDGRTSAKQVATYIAPSGGVFIDSVIHQLDYVPWLVGETPCSVVTMGALTSDFADVYEKCGDVDSTMVTLQFPSGAIAVTELIRECYLDRNYFRIEAVGTKGTELMHNSKDDQLTTLDMTGRGSDGDTESPLTFWSAYKHEMDCFIRVVQGKEKCPVPASEAIQAHRLADYCLLSLKEGRVVHCKQP